MTTKREARVLDALARGHEDAKAHRDRLLALAGRSVDDGMANWSTGIQYVEVERQAYAVALEKVAAIVERREPERHPTGLYAGRYLLADTTDGAPDE
jgi:hypothetical protein